MSEAATPTALTGSDQLIRTGPSIYRGFTIRETSGTTAAVVRIHDGVTAAGTVLDTIALNPGESAREWYHPGIHATTGVYVDVVSGAVAGSVRV